MCFGSKNVAKRPKPSENVQKRSKTSKTEKNVIFSRRGHATLFFGGMGARRRPQRGHGCDRHRGATAATAAAAAAAAIRGANNLNDGLVGPT